VVVDTASPGQRACGNWFDDISGGHIGYSSWTRPAQPGLLTGVSILRVSGCSREQSVAHVGKAVT